ncbi:hypothetical protein [Natrinema limicola]|uniref:HEAT repeat domain-containing protein n=1 Tax=Natrinema limicola JCM 13563 TaxID=1230457 RepID=M0CK17_9EURY|nr:hypothetical protein [Natrinema limicola]ELZ22973.1 hypothetical protein C476_05337 [Natrinema limicola JCM 13563]
MNESPTWYANALESGESDRVNEAIDRIEAIDATDRVPVYDDLFDACRPIYKSDDGYVRQSVVRFLRDAYPRFELRLGASATESVEGYTLDDLSEQRTALLEFLLEALTDDDGRVRRAAVDGIETLALVLATAELDAERQALAEELERLQTAHSGDVQTHIEQARRTLEERSGIGAMLSGLQLSDDGFDSDG